MTSITPAFDKSFRTGAGVISMVLASACASAAGGAASGDPALRTDNGGHTNESVEAPLQRMAPALSITRTGSGELAIKLRGPTSDYTGADAVPLYMVDGAPFHPGPNGLLSGINPQDIATVKFLRSSEAGLYGIEGSNGVILITLKKSTK